MARPEDTKTLDPSQWPLAGKLILVPREFLHVIYVCINREVECILTSLLRKVHVGDTKFNDVFVLVVHSSVCSFACLFTLSL